jgi:hypothetical protein
LVPDFKLADAFKGDSQQHGYEPFEQVRVLDKQHFEQSIGFERVFKFGHDGSFLYPPSINYMLKALFEEAPVAASRENWEKLLPWNSFTS